MQLGTVQLHVHKGVWVGASCQACLYGRQIALICSVEELLFLRLLPLLLLHRAQAFHMCSATTCRWWVVEKGKVSALGAGCRAAGGRPAQRAPLPGHDAALLAELLQVGCSLSCSGTVAALCCLPAACRRQETRARLGRKGVAPGGCRRGAPRRCACFLVPWLTPMHALLPGAGWQADVLLRFAYTVHRLTLSSWLSA